MAAKKLTDNNKNNILNDMKNNVGTSRTDEYYFITDEVSASDLEQLAFKKDTILTIVQVSNRISKLTFLQNLT